MKMLLHKFLGGINPYHKFIRNYCFGGVIDVGANKGTYSKYCIRHGAKRVYAFEPIEKLKLRKCDEIYTVALGKEKGFERFYLHKDSAQNSAIDESDVITEVRVDRLDEYTFDNVSLIKIDCQGMDYEVLLGGIKTIQKHKPAILLEVWNEGLSRRGYSNVDVEKFMQGLNYCGEKVYDCGTYYDMFYKPSTEQN